MEDWQWSRYLHIKHVWWTRRRLLVKWAMWWAMWIGMDMRLRLLLCFLFPATSSACSRDFPCCGECWTLRRWWRAARKVGIVYGFQDSLDSSANVPSDLMIAIYCLWQSLKSIDKECVTYFRLGQVTIVASDDTCVSAWCDISQYRDGASWAQHTSGETLPWAADTDGHFAAPEISSPLF